MGDRPKLLRGIAAALSTGAVLAASMPPAGLGALAWVAFWPLLAACRERNAGTRLLLGSISGLVFGAGTVGLWLFPATRAHLAASAPAALALTLTAAWLYGGVYLAALAAIHPWIPRPRWLAVPAVWVLLEWVRGFAAGGAPWALLGHSQHASAVAQVAELGGVPALSFLVMMVSAALAERGRERVAGLLAASLAVGTAFAFGAARLAAIPPADGDAGGVEILALSGRSLARDPVEAYARETLAAGAAEIALWPEGATPGYVQEEPAVRAALARSAGGRAGLLTGGRRYEGQPPERRFYNAVFLVTADGTITSVADKRRLVPLAEASPLPWLHDLAQPFSPAPGAARPVEIAGLRVGPLVCWDVLFDDLARALVRRGADVLVNLSSDRDLGAGAGQLVAFARLRAIETRRWLVRASGTGRSLVVDPAGRLLERDRARVAPVDGRRLTPFVRYGAWTPLGALVLLAALALGRRRRRRSRVAAFGS